MPTKLKAKDLRWTCTKEILSHIKDYDSLKVDESIVGQERAADALDLGLRLHRPGYNVFVAGLTGTGRLTTIRRSLEHACKPTAPQPDRCYVYNFSEPSRPTLLSFHPGQGKQFKEEMAELIRTLKAEIPKTLESQLVNKERELIVERYQREEKKLFEGFANDVKKEGFALIQVQEGGFLAPALFIVVGEEAVSVDYLDKLIEEGKVTSEEAEQKRKKHREYTRMLKEVLSKARNLGKEMHAALEKLLQRSASIVLDSLMDDILAKHKDEKVRKYLLRVKSHILKNVESFAGKEKKQEGIILWGSRHEDPFWFYEVNLLLESRHDHEKMPCSMVEEHNPNYVNLFGSIEYSVGASGVWSTDFRYIRAGSLLRADGGFLIVNALDILMRPYVWDQLKRVLKTEELVIQPPEYSMAIAPMTLKPEPIKLSVKIILIGPSWVYNLLYNYEEDFPKIFKVLADFDTSMDLTKESAKKYAAVLKGICVRGNLRPLDESGIAALIEYGVEEAGQTNKLSTRFAHIVDVVRESDFWAGEESAKRVTAKHVEKAIEKWRRRHSLIEERVQSLIEDEVILIATKGAKAGQVNGLAVYDLGHASFGKPTRVTASVGVGKSGLINIEREAKLSGPTHDKGVLILAGYLRRQYAQEMPLTLSASICFEQSYSGIDGDSASSTELYCLLSALSGLPISQEFSVTGSINQMGDIQPIGGVNEKIAGFFDVCKAQGLTGKQSVIIPKANERHLMLRKDIVNAVSQGKFHIYSVSHVDEGLELLMKAQAGKRDAKGNFPKKSIHGLVDKRLRDMAAALSKFGGEGEGTKEIAAPGSSTKPEPPKPPKGKREKKK